ncbi:hypothetical protein [Pedobacter immunditicola]|uniref:hypothetical protein n=1 Tax=Pedobacter immunditicola TaxID=3133440 RepID=UPI0030B6DE96
MEPFNIKVGYGDNEVTLTILPTKEKYYKVIYYGGIVGAIRYMNDTDGWEVVPPEEVVAGDLPLYEPDLTGERLEVVLNDETVDEIGNEITLTLDTKG